MADNDIQIVANFFDFSGTFEPKNIEIEILNMSKKKQLSARSTTIIALVVGLLFITTGAAITYVSYTFTRTAITTVGKVTYVSVSRSSSGSSGSHNTYTPTISFIDEQGAPQSAQTPVSNQDYDFALGTEISILYNPDNPNEIKLNKWFELWGFGTIFLVAGFGTIAYIIFAWKESKKTGESQNKQDGSIEDIDDTIAFLRKMGRDAEADEIIESMQSAESDSHDRDR